MANLAADNIRLWRDDPAAFARDVCGLRDLEPWQERAFGYLSAQRSDERDQRVCLVGAKGIGKTLWGAVAALHFIITNAKSKVAVISTSYDQLLDGLWSEMSSLIVRSPILSSALELTKTRVVVLESPHDWFISARALSKSASEAEIAASIAGLHSQGGTAAIVDEAGQMPIALLSGVEAIASTAGRSRIVIMGNANSREGLLYRAATSGQYETIKIHADPDRPETRCGRVDLGWAIAQRDSWGAESSFYKCNVLADWPSSEFNALLTVEQCLEATERYHKAEDIEDAPLIGGLDVAAQGDDSSVLMTRRGLMSYEAFQWRGLDSTSLAGQVGRRWDQYNFDSCQVDTTGGFGSGVVDNLRRMGYAPLDVLFSARADDPTRYFNKRAEMAWRVREFILSGGRIFKHPELIAALSQTNYAHVGDRLQIESKLDIKRKLTYSPDHADALMCTFCHPARKKAASVYAYSNNVASYGENYSPFKEAWGVGGSDRPEPRRWGGIGGWN